MMLRIAWGDMMYCPSAPSNWIFRFLAFLIFGKNSSYLDKNVSMLSSFTLPLFMVAVKSVSASIRVARSLVMVTALGS